MNWRDLFSSGVIAALVAALVALVTTERRLAAENVTQERTKWRDKVRCLADDVYKAFLVGESDANVYQRLRAQLTLRLNPHDKLDQQILELIRVDGAGSADEFIQRVALLLKHDWERAKREASLLRWLHEREPDRLIFERYQPGHRCKYVKRRWLCRRIARAISRLRVRFRRRRW
jgi:hypothetical protein